MISTRALARLTSLPVIAGILLVLALPALAAGGDLDTSWGGTGVVTTPIGEFSAADGVIARGNEVIAVGVAFDDVSGDFAVAQYQSDGTLDPSFGTGGIVTTNITDYEQADEITYMGDKLVVAGFTCPAVECDFAVVRYNKDGSLDQSFGTGGIVVTDFGGDDIADAVLVKGNTIVVAGATDRDGNNDFALARYLKDGTLDPSFGTGGLVTTDFNGNFDAANGLDIMENRIVAAGYVDYFTGDSNFGLARYLDDGSLDPSFDVDGKVETDFSGEDDGAHAIDIRGQTITAMGEATTSGDSDLAAAQYNKDGSLNPGFGGDGTSTIDVGSLFDGGRGGALQYDGRVVVVGYTCPDSCEFAVARFTSDGSPDASFGTGGFTTTPIGPFAQAQAAAFGPDNRIIAAGVTCNGTCDFATARYLAN